jgi:hypothetical protein
LVGIILSGGPGPGTSFYCSSPLGLGRRRLGPAREALPLVKRSSRQILLILQALSYLLDVLGKH